MAKLVKCKHCGNGIAKGVKACPQCGGKNGGGTFKLLLWGFAIVIAFSALMNGVGGGSKYNVPPPTAEEATIMTERVAVAKKQMLEKAAAKRLRKMAACKADDDCWRKKGYRIASRYLEPLKDAQRYAARWDDSNKLPYCTAQTTGNVMCWGKSMSIQNQFGAWRKHKYTITVNPENEDLVDVKLFPL